MKIFGFEFGGSSVTTKIVDVDKRQPEQHNIITRTVQRQLVRTNAQIDLWRSALLSAERNNYPTRTELTRVFNELVLDNHVSSLMQTRNLKVLGSEFLFCDPDGNDIPEITKLFRTAWFDRFVELSMDSKYWGFSLIQFGSIKNDKFESVELVPRELVVPERHGVMKQLNQVESLIDYNQKPFANWLIPVGINDDKGLLNKCAPLVIWKKNALGSWGEFIERFGQPARIVKTDTSNEENRAKAEEMVEQMGSSLWAVLDDDDELMFVEPSKSDPHNVFNALIERVNGEISKLILGQTMTSDDGSSLSQSQVHERVLNDINRHDLTFIEHLVNGELIPMMRQHGVNIPEGSFKYSNKEKLTLNEQFAIDKELLLHYKINPDYFTEKYGVPLEEKETETNPFENNQQEIENVFYNKTIQKYYGRN